MRGIRPPAVAGLFYPKERVALDTELERLLAGSESAAPPFGVPKAIVVPHAGYVYSGGVAARAYDALRAARGVVRRVVLLGPAHRVAVRGLAVPACEAFATPLGTIALDRAALEGLRALPEVRVSDAAHAAEHAIEVQLPFLQKVLGGFTLVPLAVGLADAHEVARVIDRLWGGPETLVVVSTDLSHYHSYDEARRIDAATLARVSACADDLDHQQACGATPLNALLRLARARKLSVRLLAACNSGDCAGGKAQVVGYSSFALYEGGEIPLRAAGDVLLAIARAAIEREVSGMIVVPGARTAWLRQWCATFVTLKKDAALRGCIGSLEPRRSLEDDVAQNAIGAAFRDPRFPPLKSDEWPSCRIEVSLLSAARPIRFADEVELLEQLRPGEDGIVLEADGRRATFLPQVWETLPDKRAFVSALMKKAGVPDDGALRSCRVLRYRVARFDGR